MQKNFFLMSLTLILMIMWAVILTKLLTKPHKSPLMIFFTCLLIFILAMLMANFLHNSQWALFLIMIPTVAGLFQLFIQLICYSFKASNSLSTVTTTPLTGNPYTTLIIASLLACVLVSMDYYSNKYPFSTTSDLSKPNFISLDMFLPTIILCGVTMFVILYLLSIFLKSASKAMKSSY